MSKTRVVHYINQFFAGIGGEDQADVGPGVVEGPKGPGLVLQKVLEGSGEVVATIDTERTRALIGFTDGMSVGDSLSSISH